MPNEVSTGETVVKSEADRTVETARVLFGDQFAAKIGLLTGFFNDKTNKRILDDRRERMEGDGASREFTTHEMNVAGSLFPILTALKKGHSQELVGLLGVQETDLDDQLPSAHQGEYGLVWDGLAFDQSVVNLRIVLRRIRGDEFVRSVETPEES